MKLKNWITTGLAVSAIATVSNASVFFSVDVGSLQNENGEALVEQGMLYLVTAGADGDFALPEAGSILGAGSDDAIVASWDLSAETSGQGEYIVGSGAVPYANDWSPGDPLAILWFPNLTVGNQVPADGEAYGFYRNQDGSVGDLWEMPQDGVMLHSLKFFTDGANPLVNGSDVPSFLAAASFDAGDDAGLPSIDIAGLSIGEPNPETATFTWNGSTVPGGGFRVERRLAGESDWTVLGIVGGDVNAYQDDSIGRGKDYEYRVVATNGFGSEVSGPQPIQTLRSSLNNLATRGVLGSGFSVLIMGFSYEGTGDISLLARTQGPELAVDTALTPQQVAADPIATLKSNINGVITDLQVNDNWGAVEAERDEIISLYSPRTFALPNSDVNSLDAGMVVTRTGSELLTIVSRDNGGAEGIALVEIFDITEELPNDATNRLVNLSTRGFVGTGAERLIGGFIIKGEVDSRVLIRGLGPALPEVITNRLSDPQLRLFDSGGNLVQDSEGNEVGLNDDWEDAQREEIVEVTAQVGAAALPDGSKNAAIVATLDPGLYTFFLEGVDSATGVGLIELFLAD